MSRRVTAAIMAATTTACAGGELAWTGTVTDSAGITMVANPAEGIWNDTNRWTLNEELRIGVVQGDPDYQFGRVAGITIGSDSSIYVLDGQERRVKVYSSRGNHIRTIGGPGGGPGEIAGAGFLCMAPGDTLLVADEGNLRINRYAPDGSSIGSIRISGEQGRAVRRYCTVTGAIVEQVQPPLVFGTSPGDATISNAVIGLRHGEVLDTLHGFERVATFRGWGPDSEVWLFSPTPLWAVTEDLRLVFAVDTDYRFAVYLSGGTPDRIVTKSFVPERVSDRHKEVITGFLERSWRELFSPQLLQLRLSGVRFEDFFPVMANIAVGPQRTVWVQRMQPTSQLESWAAGARSNPVRALTEGRAAEDWDVFDEEGRYLGLVAMPSRFEPYLFRQDRIYGVWRDELDVQYVVGLRVAGL